MTRLFEKGILLFAAVLPAVGTYLIFFQLSGAGIQIAYSTEKILMVLLPAVTVFVVSGWRGFSAQSPVHHLKDIAVYGIGLGVAAGILILGLYELLQHREVFVLASDIIQTKLADAGVVSVSQFIVLAAFISVGNATLEEYYWRWFLFGRLRQFVTPAIAGLLASIAFVFHHIVVLAYYLPSGSAGWISLLCTGVFLGGLFWCYVFHKSGTIWSAWVAHGIVDIAIMLVGYQMIF